MNTHVSTASPTLTRATLFAMALATGTAVANIYYNQPMLGMIEKSFPHGPAAALVPTLTQVGYALGLLFLLPLGDLFERRRLIVVQFLAVAVASLLAAVSSGVTELLLASVLIGAAATVAQQIVPFTAILAAPERRGQAIGFVMSGLLTGILFSRTLAGFIATWASWRAMFWVGVPIALLSALLMAACLPKHEPVTRVHYRQLLVSIASLWRHEPVLRRSALPRPACSRRLPPSGRYWHCALSNRPSTRGPRWPVCSVSSARWAWPWRHWPDASPIAVARIW